MDTVGPMEAPPIAPTPVPPVKIRPKVMSIRPLGATSVEAMPLGMYPPPVVPLRPPEMLGRLRLILLPVC